MRYLVLMLSFFVLGCSNSNPPQSNTLSNQFTQYKNAAPSPDEKQYVTAELWDTLAKARASIGNADIASSVAYFPQEIVKTTDIKEVIEGSSGCLLVSGLNEQQIPIDYYIRYQLDAGKWLIHDVAIKYFLDGAERYLDYAECDEEKRMELWLQSIQ